MKMLITSVLAIFLFVAVTKDSYSQVDKKVLDKPIIIQPGSIRIDSLLKYFSKQTGVEFSFNSNKISPSKKVLVSTQKKTVSQWLSLFNQSFGIQHKVIGNHIILIDNRGKKEISKQTVSKKNVFQNAAPNSSNNISPQKRTTENIEKNKSSEPETLGMSHVIPKADIVQREQSWKINKSDDLISDTASSEPDKFSLPEKIKMDDSNSRHQEINRVNDIANGELLQVLLGYSKHGSGDMKGIVFSSEYWKNISRKISIGIMLRATINSDKHTIIFENISAGTVTDASIRFTTAGLQLGTIAGFNFINSQKSKLALGLGIFGRYQSASNGSDGYSIIYPSVTNYPGVLIEYHNSTPQHTFSFGGLLQCQYLYFFNDKIYTGAVAGFQTDTNGDAIPQISLVFGKRFRRD